MKSSAAKTSAKVRILVADDHPFLRVGLSHLINHQTDMACCGEAENIPGLFKSVAALKPDLLLLDLYLGEGDGLETIKSLKAQFADLPVLVLSQEDETLYAERVLRAGASGYVMKERPPEEVLGAIRSVLAGELHVSKKVAAHLLRKSLQGRPESGGGGDGTNVERLTDRELQVFRSIGAGLTTRQIAEELKLSFKTIETYRENIKHKLDLRDAVALIRAATDWSRAHAHSPTREDVAASKRARR